MSLTRERLSHSSPSPSSPLFTFTLLLSERIITGFYQQSLAFTRLSYVSSLLLLLGFSVQNGNQAWVEKREKFWNIFFMTHGTTTKINRRGGDMFCKFVFAFLFFSMCCFETSGSHMWDGGCAGEGVAVEDMYIRPKTKRIEVFIYLFFCQLLPWITLELNRNNKKQTTDLVKLAFIYICQDTVGGWETV